MESGMRTTRRGRGLDVLSFAALCREQVRVGDVNDEKNLVLEAGVLASSGDDSFSTAVVCLEKKSTSEINSAGVSEMEVGMTEELRETAVDSVSSKTYCCSDQTMGSEGTDIATLGVKTGIRVEEAEGREDLDVGKGSLSTAVAPEDHDFWLPKLTNETALGPVTPLPAREVVDFSSLTDQTEEAVEFSSPLPAREVVQFSSLSDQTEEAELVSECETPSEVIFDPFAPGPEELVLAPKKKMLMQTRVHIQRQLNFDYCGDSNQNSEDDILEVAEEEERFLDMVYRSLLDVIVSNQVGEFSGESPFEGSTLSEGLKTPTSLPLLTGIAETCPGAPVKPASKSRKLSIGICRRLEF